MIVHIVGYTDSSGSAEYNQGLSARRAQSVVGCSRNSRVPLDRMRTDYAVNNGREPRTALELANSSGAELKFI